MQRKETTLAVEKLRFSNMSCEAIIGGTFSFLVCLVLLLYLVGGALILTFSNGDYAHFSNNPKGLEGNNLLVGITLAIIDTSSPIRVSGLCPCRCKFCAIRKFFATWLRR
jgi:hypothetical protein